MKSIDFVYLSQEDVIQAGLTMSDTMAIVEDVLKDHADKFCENPPKPGVHPLADAFIHAMPAYLPRKNISGMKWVSGFFGNPRYGLPSIMGLLALNDVTTGQPVAVMEAGYITALRTAALSGVSARYLAVAGAKRVGIVGAGIQGRYNLLSLKEVLPGLQCVRVYDTDSHAAARLKDVLQGHVPFQIEIGPRFRRCLKRRTSSLLGAPRAHFQGTVGQGRCARAAGGAARLGNRGSRENGQVHCRRLGPIQSALQR
jgi:ornithine cyclodeaminase/alanine dehydrogenase